MNEFELNNEYSCVIDVIFFNHLSAVESYTCSSFKSRFQVQILGHISEERTNFSSLPGLDTTLQVSEQLLLPIFLVLLLVGGSAFFLWLMIPFDGGGDADDLCAFDFILLVWLEVLFLWHWYM